MAEEEEHPPKGRDKGNFWELSALPCKAAEFATLQDHERLKGVVSMQEMVRDNHHPWRDYWQHSFRCADSENCP